MIVYVLRSVMQTGNGATGSLIGGVNPSVAIGTSKLWGVAPDGRRARPLLPGGERVTWIP